MVSLWLKTSSATFTAVPAASQLTDHNIKLLELPSMLALSVSFAGSRAHGTHASVDRATLQRVQAADPAAKVRIVMPLADPLPFELAA